MCDGRVYLADPIRGNVRPTIAEFHQQWQQKPSDFERPGRRNRNMGGLEWKIAEESATRPRHFR